LPGKTKLISASTGILTAGKRYILWFYLLNLAFAWSGAAAFSKSAHGILDHSLYADRLLHGMDLAVLEEMIERPEFGPRRSSEVPALMFGFLFFLASLLFMPGVLLGYSSDHRISAEEFFRACGRNVWRFVRLAAVFALLAGIATGIGFSIQGGLMNAVDQSSQNDRLLSLVEWLSLGVTFLLLTVMRIWFDLAETDVVLRDRPAVRKSILWAFRATLRNFFRLLATYLLAAVAAALILLGGIFLWHLMVPPANVVGAFLVSQVTLLLLLASRFWQRAIAVAFYQRISTERAIELSSTAIRAPAIPAP
jgi:hypothetical protein